MKTGTFVNYQLAEALLLLHSYQKSNKSLAEFEVELTPLQTVTIIGLIPGTSFTVSEKETAGYSQTTPENNGNFEGEIEAGKTKVFSAKFINAKEEKGSLKIKKTVSGASLSDAKTFLGQCVYRTRRKPNGSVEKYDFKLRINTRLDLPEREVEDIIIHEMIHYYIGFHQLKDTSAHGQIFRQIMNEINTKLGRNLSISHKSTKEQREKLVDQKPHYHVIAVVTFHNGKTGIKVLPRILQRILYYYNNVLANREVKTVELYMSNNPYFNRFPNSSALKVHYLDIEIIRKNLEGADKMGCDGKSLSYRR